MAVLCGKCCALWDGLRSATTDLWRTTEPHARGAAGELDHDTFALHIATIQRLHRLSGIFFSLKFNECYARVRHATTSVPRHNVHPHKPAERLKLGLKGSTSYTVLDALDTQRRSVHNCVTLQAVALH